MEVVPLLIFPNVTQKGCLCFFAHSTISAVNSWLKCKSPITVHLLVFRFQVWWLATLFLQSLSVSGLPRTVQVRPRFSPLSGVSRPEHPQTGSGAAGLGGTLALPASGRVSDGKQPRWACTVLFNWKVRRLGKYQRERTWASRRRNNRLWRDNLAF